MHRITIHILDANIVYGEFRFMNKQFLRMDATFIYTLLSHLFFIINASTYLLTF